MPPLINTTNPGAVHQRLALHLARSRDLSPLKASIVKVLYDANKDRAARGIDYLGRPFAPLAKRTLEDRRRKGLPAGPPLSRHGAQSRVVTGCEVFAYTDGNVLRVTKSWRGIPWMIEHINGNPARNLPQRDLLGWGTEEIGVVKKMLPSYLTLGRW